MLSYKPAILNYPDTYTYVYGAAGEIFQRHPLRPAGYAAMLAALAWFGNIPVTIAVQHVLGLATALLTYVLFRRLGAPWGIALVPAAAYALTPDQLYFEHSLLSEAPFTFLLVAGVLLAVCSLQVESDGRRVAWAAAAGAVVAFSATVRTVGLVLVPVLVIGLIASPDPPPWRRRLVSSFVLLVATAAVLGGYGIAQQRQVGYFGLTELGGWALYGRVAPFANCGHFDPPQGTRGLCEKTDWRQRPGPDFYVWDPASPAWKLFGAPPRHSDKLGAFARSALRADPSLYARSVAKDLIRYVNSGFGYDRPGSGAAEWRYAIDLRGPNEEASNMSIIRRLYGRQRIEVGGATDLLADLQPIIRVRGSLILLSVIAMIAGVALGGRALAAALVFTGGAAAAVIAFPTATTEYNYRYAVPALPLLLGAGVFGAWGLGSRVGLNRRALGLWRRVGDAGSTRS